MMKASRLYPLLAILITLVSAILVPRLRLSGSLARLFPDDPAAKALGAYVDAFGGGDVTVVLVRGQDPAQVEAAADAIAKAAEGKPGVKRATTSVAPKIDPDAAPPDPTLAWAFANDEERKELDQALTEAGMRSRLDETRALLLMPGSSGISRLITHDPLRLFSIVRGRARTVAATVGADESGALVADQGRARFVLVSTVGSALDSDDAKRLVGALESAIAEVVPKHPGVTATIAGGAAIARDVERMIRRDLYVSSAVSTLLVALAFVVTFRRVRALAAIGPPLLLGTLWTTALAAVLPGGITAIAMGFASVVIGVGLDTGVHVYAAVERARAHDPNASFDDVADAARREVARPTLTAAIAAAFAFGAMTLSRLPALRQLGVLCAAGEVLTALAILALTPTIAAHLEKKAIERPPSHRLEALASSIASPRGGRIVALCVVACGIALAIAGIPRPGEAIVALKPQGLPSLAAQEEAIKLTSGAAGEVQLTITQSGKDESEVLARAERLAAKLPTTNRTVESIAPWLPSDATLRARIADRDAQDLPKRADDLARLLGELGFSVDPFAPAMEHLRRPASLDLARTAVARLREGALAPLVARHVARHPKTGDIIVATYVRGPGLSAEALARDVAAIDPQAVVTGYPVLDTSLRAALARDLPRVALVALVLVAIALRSVLHTLREVGVALVALAVELLVVALVVRLLHVRIHVYDALVLPVLLGITVDESMFLLHAMREGDGAASAIRREGRAIVTTATTTAAGFAALLGCGFPGLRDLGTVGLVGTLAGLLASLVVVPAAATLLVRPRSDLDGASRSDH